MLAYFYMHDMSWGWGVLMTIATLAILGLIVFGAVALWRDRRRESPADVLKQRLARGEITLDEYERLRGAIAGPPVPPASAV